MATERTEGRTISAALPSREERKRRQRGQRRSGVFRFISLLLAVALAGTAVLTVLSLEVLWYIRESPYQYWGFGGALALALLWLLAALAAGRSATRAPEMAAAVDQFEVDRVPVRLERPGPGQRVATGAGPQRVPPGECPPARPAGLAEPVAHGGSAGGDIGGKPEASGEPDAFEELDEMEMSLSLNRERVEELRRAINDAFPDMFSGGETSADNEQHSS